jgi:hypothetical protein
MRVHIGIMCDVCRMVHFIATSSTIKPSPMNREMYRLVCAPPCSEVREFRKDSMRPYRVTDTVFKTGHTEDGEYEFVGAPNEGQKAGSTTHCAETHAEVVRPEQNRKYALPKTEVQKADSE